MAYITPYAQYPKFRVANSVFRIIRHDNGSVSHEGPYLIERVLSLERYTLCTSDGTSIGGPYTVEDLVAAAQH
ncbi:hypothetical protein BJX68DRAFT_266364 [Aspergillus pseudodeflectus]|uniref:Uncharacterized protein n=1 Tax=Aspergillus pseudodeflectus TaxID=176178 RepID=A0ABR4KF06_9EURO